MFTQMYQMTPAEYKCHKRVMVYNFPLTFYPTHSLKHKENGAQLNKRPMEFTTVSQSGITIFIK